jgi:hypothetical protein
MIQHIKLITFIIAFITPFSPLFCAKQKPLVVETPYSKYVFTLKQINQAKLPDSSPNWTQEIKIDWIKENENIAPLSVVKILQPYLNYIKHISNDIVLINLLHYNSVRHAEHKKTTPYRIQKEKQKEEWEIIQRIKDPKIQTAALTLPHIYRTKQISNALTKINDVNIQKYVCLNVGLGGDAVVPYISDTDTLIYINENTKDPEIKYLSARRLRNQFQPSYIWEGIMDMKWAFLFFVFTLLIAFGAYDESPVACIVPVSQLIFIMLEWRITRGTAWPGFIGYFVIPLLGLVAPYAVYSVITSILSFTDKLPKSISFISEKIVYLISSLICLASALYIDHLVFGTGTYISGSSAPTGTHYLSDAVLADESLWGYVIYLACSVEIMMFLSTGVLVLSLFFSHLFEDGIKVIDAEA